MKRIPHPTVGRNQYDLAVSITKAVVFLVLCGLSFSFFVSAVDRSRAGLPFSVRETVREMFGNYRFTTNLPNK